MKIKFFKGNLDNLFDCETDVNNYVAGEEALEKEVSISTTGGENKVTVCVISRGGTTPPPAPTEGEELKEL